MKAIIMAAGKGTRLQEAGNPMPKVLRRANDRPLLDYVFDAMPMIDKKDITVVTGFMSEMVEEYYKDMGCSFQRQGDAAYGTGYAVMCGLENENFNDYHGDILIVCGDAPVIKLSTVEGIIKMHEDEGNKATLLSSDTKLKLPYGRIIRNENGNVIDIREEKDCSEEEKKITELNIGTYVFNADALREGLKMIDCNNAAGEYYLTDVPPAIAQMGEKVNAFITYDDDELVGVNTPDDLALVEKILKSR
ncbi:MAG: NTP transferase domain-containing protein [Clostridia bacterium]|nr:NTP transferase domain-containing protein [Clostridia bacterium]